jgi:hypothetical protein
LPGSVAEVASEVLVTAMMKPLEWGSGGHRLTFFVQAVRSSLHGLLQTALRQY